MTTRDMSGITKPDWLPAPLYSQWVDLYIEAGGTGTPGAGGIATEQLRQTPEYDQFFPGIKRDDGSIRYPNFPEATYLNNLESFRRTVESAGLNPDLFEGEEYVNLIEQDVSPQEFNTRVENINARVLLAGEDIRRFYGENFGVDLSREGIVASLMSDRVGEAILNRQITMAEIGGEAAMRNYELSTTFVEMLSEQGMNRDRAQYLFGSAEALMPVLGALARRHGDPDDDFDIEEFVEGVEGLDPLQAERMARLQQQEAAQFTGGAAVERVRSSRGLGITGLEAR